jgi:hypothetical protein
MCIVGKGTYAGFEKVDFFYNKLINYTLTTLTKYSNYATRPII